jgi:fimbrial isopeptide formation D2 family protein
VKASFAYVADAFSADVPGSAGATGDAVAWTIRGNIENGSEDLYTITDDLDPRLRFTGAQASLDIDGTLTPLDPADFTVTTSPTPANGSHVVVELTASGLAKINAADPATTRVVATINTTIRANARGANLRRCREGSSPIRPLRHRI